jgi:hypothetical protein
MCLKGTQLERNQPAGFTSQELIEQQVMTRLRYRSHQGDFLVENHHRQL